MIIIFDFKPYVGLLVPAAGVMVTCGGVAVVGALVASGALVPVVDMAVQAIA